MKRLILLLALVGCEANSPANRLKNNNAIQEQLPEGCTIKYLGDFYKGSYPDVPIVIVDCENTTMVNSNAYVSKNTTAPSAVVKIKQLNNESEEKIKEEERLRTRELNELARLKEKYRL